MCLIGCWPYFDDVNSGKEFEPTSIHRSWNKELLCTGDTAGNIKIYNHPCIVKEVILFLTYLNYT